MRRKRTLIKAALSLGALALAATWTVPTAIAGGPPPQVNEANPAWTEQGMTGVDVTISGKNFSQGAQVRFFVTGGQNPGGVQVRNVTFVSPKTLVATIDVEDTAEISPYDIEVELLSGRKGKGTEKFAVYEKGSGGPQSLVRLCATFDNAPGDLLRSDTLGDTYCDSEERNLRVTLGNTFGAFNLNTPKSSREVILDIPDCERLIGGDCSTDGALATLNEWENVGLGLVPGGFKLDVRTIPIGTTAWADFQVQFPSRSKASPHLVVFGGSNRHLCGDPLPVTRVDQNTWVIEASSEAACLVEVVSKNNREITRRNFLVPFRIVMTRE